MWSLIIRFHYRISGPPIKVLMYGFKYGKDESFQLVAGFFDTTSRGPGTRVSGFASATKFLLLYSNLFDYQVHLSSAPTHISH